MSPWARRMVVGCLALLVAGCVTTYQPRGAGGGYQDEKISEDTYRVTYYASGSTSRPVLLKYFLYRCAELTLANGYPYFELYSTEREPPRAGWTATGIVRMYPKDIMAGAPTLFSAKEVVGTLGSDVRSANPSNIIPSRFRAVEGDFPMLVVREVKRPPRASPDSVRLEDLDGLRKQ